MIRVSQNSFLFFFKFALENSIYLFMLCVGCVWCMNLVHVQRLVLVLFKKIVLVMKLMLLDNFY
jgi:hypothetical protein